MEINGSPVTPVVSGSAEHCIVTYAPTTSFALGQVINVSISAEDLSAETNRVEHKYSFIVADPSQPRPEVPVVITEPGHSQAVFGWLQDAVTRPAWIAVLIIITTVFFVPFIIGLKRLYLLIRKGK